jgi:hypothetical protein
MDFEDERYVKLYVRDTPTWVSFMPETRAVLPNLMRKLDKSGRIEWPPKLGVRALAASLMLREKWVEIALADLAEHETIELHEREGWLVMPRYRAGQDAKQRAKTGAERTAEYNARKAAERGQTTRSDDASPEVTSDALSQLSHPSYPNHPTEQRAGARTKAAASKRAKTPKALDLRVVPVLEAIDRERAKHGLGPLPPSERHERPILTRLEDGVELEDLVLAVELHGLADDGAGRLNATTPFTAPSGRGPGGWSWSRRLLDEHRARAPRRPAMIDDHDLPDWMRSKPEPPKDEPA